MATTDVAALMGQELGLIENWLRHIQDIRNVHAKRLDAIKDFETRGVVVSPLPCIGWAYGLDDGILRDLGMGVSHTDEILPAYERTLTTTDSEAATTNVGE